MAAGSSKSAVVFAVVGNGFLTLLKLGAFLLSGSGAMLSEAIHSFADTGNQALLYLGIRRSSRPANAAFHYGFGADRFFYALMSAVGIFVLGCGVTAYHGVYVLLHPHDLAVTWHTYTVLAIALVVDGFVLMKAVRVVQEQKGTRGFFEFVRSSTDPTLAAVLLEDAVACIGVLVAFAGIFLSKTFESHVPDALATFAIAGMMGFIAIFLGMRNRALLLGQAIPENVQAEIVKFLADEPTIVGVHDVRTRVIGAGHFRLKADVEWDGAALAERLEDWVELHAKELDSADKRRAFSRSFGARMTDVLAAEIDRIEGALKERHPELKHIDFESD